MAIEFITPELVRIKGYIVEIADTRTPDYLDELSERENAALRPSPMPPIHDLEFSVSRDLYPSAHLDLEFMAYQQIPRFVDLAQRAAAERAVSYRGFKVGASACAFSLTEQKVGYLFGANYTPHAGADKNCAEMDVIDKARARGFDRIMALAVFGPPKFEDVQVLPAPTLHPCGQCRTLLETDPLINDDTLVITANETGAQELMTARDLIELHRAQS